MAARRLNEVRPSQAVMSLSHCGTPPIVIVAASRTFAFKFHLYANNDLNGFQACQAI
jgi:hypothetical protein